MREWNIDRVMKAADLLGIDPTEVTPFDIGVCNAWFGEPPSEDEAPALRRDRRFGSRRHHLDG
jgi:hypothetical protein